MLGVEWTQLLKDLNAAVQVRNASVAALRNAGARVSDLVAQAIATGAPGTAVTKALAAMDPVIAVDRPHVCGQNPVVPPLRPASVRQQATDTQLDAEEFPPRPARYSLAEAFEEGILPWKASTTRTYFKRSRERGVPVPSGEPDSGTTRYTKDELTTWVQAWKQQAGLSNGGRPTEPKASQPVDRA
ncbi:hypothetical protein PV411_33940 [Streptomyces sp. NRRL_B-16638]|uniref:Uncharacterized protein n=2 Tax=Streptomyces coelicolor TaxID=1902 RepID=Q9ACV8_STRCO|nr:hypothetical protein [Streptomyces sp. NRRL_B-16638]AGO88655.1 hypothetical protein [Streptomyces coelicolor]MDX2929507.1 hypothetical protein [Streptomyces sp. NRRL_B-16638]CAC36715.1 hypothetical protein [Streptomyces coelicolor A3(2)]